MKDLSIYIPDILERSLIQQWSYNTIKSVRQIVNLVSNFDPYTSFDNINKEWFDRFIVFQQSHKLKDIKSENQENPKYAKYYQNGYANNVNEKNCRIFKWFLKCSAEKGFISQQLVDSLKISLKKLNGLLSS